jgi:hypothetical protein
MLIVIIQISSEFGYIWEGASISEETLRPESSTIRCHGQKEIWPRRFPDIFDSEILTSESERLPWSSWDEEEDPGAHSWGDTASHEYDRSATEQVNSMDENVGGGPLSWSNPTTFIDDTDNDEDIDLDALTLLRFPRYPPPQATQPSSLMFSDVDDDHDRDIVYERPQSRCGFLDVEFEDDEEDDEVAGRLLSSLAHFNKMLDMEEEDDEEEAA